MRLIDADEILKEIVKRCGCIPYVESRKGETIYLNNLISEQPTAYDVDKVVEGLRLELGLADKEKERCAKENPLQFDEAKGYARGVAVALEVVKSGCIE